MDKLQYIYIGKASLKAERSDVRKKTGNKRKQLYYQFNTIFSKNWELFLKGIIR